MANEILSWLPDGPVTEPDDSLIRARIAGDAELPLQEFTDENIFVVAEALALGRVLSQADLAIVQRFLHFPFKSEREQLERQNELSQNAEALFGLEIDTATYGLYVANYAQPLLEQRDRSGVTDGNHTSLLVGAATRNSIREYSSTVHSVYPQADCKVIDIEGVTTAQIPSEVAEFRRGSALKIPFASGTIDSVHTNLLLRDLRDLEKPDARSKHTRRRFYKESKRVMRDGGVLLMVEEDPQAVADDLVHAGFSHVDLRESVMFRKRRGMESHFQSGQALPRRAFVRPQGTKFVVATK